MTGNSSFRRCCKTPSKKDITGEKRFMATAIRPIESRRGTWYWEFECDCGNHFISSGKDFSHGKIKSCGCLNRKKASIRAIERNTTHGKRNTRLYTIWKGMKARCGNPSATGFSNYGGRGIHVCSQWINNFEEFYHWAVSNGYADNLTIDRINNDKGYCPDNCRWVTMKDQQNNRRNNVAKRLEGAQP